MGGLLYEAKKETKKSFAVRKFPKIFGFMGFFEKKTENRPFRLPTCNFLFFLQISRDLPKLLTLIANLI